MKSVTVRIFCCVLCFVIIAVFAGCSGQTAKQANETTQAAAETETISEDVKAQLDAALSENKFDGMVQITKGGHVIYQYVKGDDDNGQPLTIDSSLPVGSVSKQFCAACVMLLCDQKKLSADDTLDKYFPEYKYGDKMKVKDLLTMSSGLQVELALEPSALGKDETENVKVIKEAIFSDELKFEPGEDYMYSNSNYFLLANIVEQVSGVPYHEYLRKNFLEPLEMTHTGFVEEISEDHEWTSALSKTELMDETTLPGLAKGAGDVVSNPADMDKWMRGLSSGKIISTDAYQQMTGNPNPNSVNGYSYGLWEMPFDGFGHLGQIEPHFSAVDYLNPDRGVFLFAASNSMSGMSFMDSLPYTLLNIYFEKD